MVRGERLLLSDLDLLPVHLPLFQSEELVFWRDEPARISSPAFVFDECYYYDLTLTSSGQLILGVCEDDLLSLVSVAAGEPPPEPSDSFPQFAAVIEIPE